MENSITYFSLIAIAIVSVAAVVNMGYIVSLPFKIARGVSSLGVVWLIMLLGMGQWFERESGVTSITSVDASAYIQIASISIALVALLAYIGRSFSTANFSMPLLMFFIYALAGFLMAPMAPSPALSAFKALSLIVSSLLAVVAIDKLSRAQSPLLLYQITYAYFSVLVVLALFGGVLFPEITHRPSGGVFGFMLVGWPSLNSNSLSYVAAVVFVISIHRYFLETVSKRKFLYIGLAVSASVALMLAQGRTSLGGAFFAIVFMAFAIREMAVMRYVAGLMAFILVSLLLVTGTVGDWVIGLEEYLRRGVSDEQLATLSGRTDAWQHSWELFKDSPLAGYGFYAAGKVLVAPHNAYFTVLLNVGLIGFMPWVIGIILGFLKITLQFTKRIVAKNKLASRYHKEILAVMIIQFLRTVTGQDLSVHSYSFLLFFSVLVYIYAWEKMCRGGILVASGSDDSSVQLNHRQSGKLQILKRKV